MPLNSAESAALQTAVGQLDLVCQAINTIVGGATPAPATAEKLDILQKNFAEISNYDRHYSTVRSALTTLVVGAGLIAAAEPLKALTQCKDSATLSFLLPTLETFSLTWLLFLLAVIVSVHFQRLTYACRKLEEEIERRIARTAGLANLADSQVVGVQIHGFLFRDDLSKVHKKVRIYFDEMSILLLVGISIFVGMIVAHAFRKCDTIFFYKYPTLLWAAGVVFLGILVWGLLRLIDFIQRKRG